MSRPLPASFSKDIQARDTNLFPLIVIGNWNVDTFSEETFIDDYAKFISGEDNGGTHFISTKDYTYQPFDGAPVSFLPILLNVPSIKQSLDIEKRKYKISNVSIDISNYKYNGKRFSDLIGEDTENYKTLINTQCRIFWWSPSTDVMLPDDIGGDFSGVGRRAFQVYSGIIRRYEHDDKKARLIVEDRSQSNLNAEIPTRLGMNDTIPDKNKNKPIPMVFGYVDKSPCLIENKEFSTDGTTTLIYDTEDSGSWVEGTNPLYIYDSMYTHVPHISVEFGYPTHYQWDAQYGSKLVIGKSYEGFPNDKPAILTVYNQFNTPSIVADHDKPAMHDAPHVMHHTTNTELHTDSATGVIAHCSGTLFREDSLTHWQDNGTPSRTTTWTPYQDDIESIENYLGNGGTYYQGSHVGMSVIMPYNIPGTLLDEYGRLRCRVQVYTYNYELWQQITQYDDLKFKVISGQSEYSAGEIWNHNGSGLNVHPNYHGGSMEIPFQIIDQYYGYHDDDEVYQDPIVLTSDILQFQFQCTLHPDTRSIMACDIKISQFDYEHKALITDYDKLNFYTDVAGRGYETFGGSPTAPEVIEHILGDVLNLDTDGIETTPFGSDADDENFDWRYDFTIDKTINTKKLIENIASVSPYIMLFDSTGNFTFKSIKQKFCVDSSPSGSCFDVTNESLNGPGSSEYNIIHEDDVIDFSFSRTPIEDVYTKIDFKYKWDYGEGKFLNRRSLDVDVFTCEYLDTEGGVQGYQYDYYGFKKAEDNIHGDHTNTTLVIDDDRGKYIRQDDTANKFVTWLLSWHMNQHLKMKIKLPLSYMSLEIGDYIRINDLLGGIKPYGIDYTKVSNLLGLYQLFHPFFMIFNTKKTLEYVEISCIQMHTIWCTTAHEVSDEGIITNVYEGYESSGSGGASRTGCDFILGCTDFGACNYNAIASGDDGSCVYPGYECQDPNIDCYAGDEGSPTTTQTGFNCDGTCKEGYGHTQTGLPDDCHNCIIGGEDNVELWENCCAADGNFIGCDGICNSEETYNECQDCGGLEIPYSCGQDIRPAGQAEPPIGNLTCWNLCNTYCGDINSNPAYNPSSEVGGAPWHMAGCHQSPGDMSIWSEEAGQWMCNCTCISDCDCDGNQLDCNGECGGSAVYDECGVCGGNGECVDCMGILDGPGIEDECGECYNPEDDPPPNTCKSTLKVVGWGIVTGELQEWFSQGTGPEGGPPFRPFYTSDTDYKGFQIGRVDTNVGGDESWEAVYNPNTIFGGTGNSMDDDLLFGNHTNPSVIINCYGNCLDTWNESEQVAGDQTDYAGCNQECANLAGVGDGAAYYPNTLEASMLPWQEMWWNNFDESLGESQNYYWPSRIYFIIRYSGGLIQEIAHGYSEGSPNPAMIRVKFSGNIQHYSQLPEEVEESVDPESQTSECSPIFPGTSFEDPKIFEFPINWDTIRPMEYANWGPVTPENRAVGYYYFMPAGTGSPQADADWMEHLFQWPPAQMVDTSGGDEGPGQTMWMRPTSHHQVIYSDIYATCEYIGDGAEDMEILQPNVEMFRDPSSPDLHPYSARINYKPPASARSCEGAGDMNMDGNYNVLDIVALSNCVLHGGPDGVSIQDLEGSSANNLSLMGCINAGGVVIQQDGTVLTVGPPCWADINGDGSFNILDIVGLVNCVLAHSCLG